MLCNWCCNFSLLVLFKIADFQKMWHWWCILPITVTDIFTKNWNVPQDLRHPPPPNPPRPPPPPPLPPPLLPIQPMHATTRSTNTALHHQNRKSLGTHNSYPRTKDHSHAHVTLTNSGSTSATLLTCLPPWNLPRTNFYTLTVPKTCQEIHASKMLRTQKKRLTMNCWDKERTNIAKDLWTICPLGGTCVYQDIIFSKVLQIFKL